MKKFIKTINNTFNLKYMNQKNDPICIKEDIDFPQQTKRLNHYNCFYK